MDVGREELLELAGRIRALRAKIAALPVSRELASLELEFDQRCGTAPAPKMATATPTPAPTKKTVKAKPVSKPPPADTLRARVETVFRHAHGPLTWAQVGKTLGVEPNTMRSTMSSLLDKKRIKRVDRGTYIWIGGAEVGNGQLALEAE